MVIAMWYSIAIMAKKTRQRILSYFAIFDPAEEEIPVHAMRPIVDEVRVMTPLRSRRFFDGIICFLNTNSQTARVSFWRP